jgi:hypothetical protein
VIESSNRLKIRTQKRSGDRGAAYAADRRGGSTQRWYWGQHAPALAEGPEFDAGFRAARRAAHGQTTVRLQQGSFAAATILMKVMLDQNTPASTRVRAAEIIVNHAAKAIEIEDVEARVAALEAAAASGEKRR